MKRIILLFALCSCSTSDPQSKNQNPSQTASEELVMPDADPAPDSDEGLRYEDRHEGTVDVEEIMHLGVQMHEAQEQLDDVHRIAVFLDCLRKSTGNHDINVSDMVVHFELNTKHAKRCKRKISKMSDDEITQKATTWLEKESESGGED